MITRKHLLRDKRAIDPKLTTEHSRIGQLLYFRFEELGCGFLFLEKITGLGKCKIKRIFNGSQDLTLYELIKICEGLRMKVSDLWSYENIKKET